jgi:formylglycine-generating enzyme required for sulfatase activity
MPSEAGERAIKASMVQFLDAKEKVRGCGLFVDPWHVITCAHVVALANSAVKADQKDKPTDKIRVVFPYHKHDEIIYAHVIEWKPLTQQTPSDLIEDIAVLKLTRCAPDDAVPHGVMLQTEWAGRAYMVQGYPESDVRGAWADGKFKGGVANGRVQMLPNDGDDLQIDKGFSGGGVWDEQMQGFAGIMVTNRKRDESKPVSHMIPGTILKRAWDALPVSQAMAQAIVNTPKMEPALGAKLSNEVKAWILIPTVMALTAIMVGAALLVLFLLQQTPNHTGGLPTAARPTARELNNLITGIKESHVDSRRPNGLNKEILNDSAAKEYLLGRISEELDSGRDSPSTREKALETASLVLAAILLSNDLGKLEAYLDFRKHPRERAYIIRMCSAWKIPAQLLIQHYSNIPPPEPSIKQAILLALAKDSSVPDVHKGWVQANVLTEFTTNEDPGVHSAAEFLLSNSTFADRVKAAKKELIETRSESKFLTSWNPETATAPNWFVNKAGMTMIAIPRDLEVFITSQSRLGVGEGKKKFIVSTIPRAFAISATEVSNGQYELLASDLQDRPPHNRAKACVTWVEARDFCAKLDSQEQIKPFIHVAVANLEVEALQNPNYRLPTVAEWTLAARGWSASETARSLPGKTELEEFTFFFGNDDMLLDDYEYVGPTQMDSPQTPVGYYYPNPLGLFDVHSSVSEMCRNLDKNKEYPRRDDGTETFDDGTGDRAVKLRSRLGGSFSNSRKVLTDWGFDAEVFAFGETTRRKDMGFRVAKTLLKP